MLEKYVTRACEWIAARLRLRTITREDGRPYLLRHYIQRHLEKYPRVPGLYLHCFMSSDDPVECHNHPFLWSLSLILTGGYYEDRVIEKWEGPPEPKARLDPTPGTQAVPAQLHPGQRLPPGRLER